MDNVQSSDSRSSTSSAATTGSHHHQQQQQQQHWRFWGGRQFPKSEVVFFTQIVLLYIVCICSLVNLSLGNKNQLWVILLTSGIGYLMPNPSLKKRTTKIVDDVAAAAVLSNVA